MTRLSHLTSCDGALVRRSRYGDRRAASRLAARHLDRIAMLSSVVGTSPEESAELAKLGFARALHSKRSFGDALVEAFGELAAAASDADQAQGQLLVVLVDLELRPVSEAAALLGLTPPRDDELLSLGRAGAALPGRACRGWGLASGRSGLTAAELHAGIDHLALCRHCRDRLAARERARSALLARTSAVAALVGASHLAALVGASSTSTGVLASKLALGKVATGVVGALGAAVLATGGVAAIAQQRPATTHTPGTATHPLHPRRQSAPAVTPTAGSPDCGQSCSSKGKGPGLVRTPDLPVPTAVPGAQLDVPSLPLPLPTLLTVPALPHLQLPKVQLPTPLPTSSLPLLP